MDRKKFILQSRKAGLSYKKIGILLGLSRQRIEQIEKNLFTGRDKVRELTRKRDKHTCQDCGKKWLENSRRFDIHHLNGLCGKRSRKYDLESDMPGLITLCHKCHFNRPEHASKKLSKD